MDDDESQPQPSLLKRPCLETIVHEHEPKPKPLSHQQHLENQNWLPTASSNCQRGSTTQWALLALAGTTLKLLLLNPQTTGHQHHQQRLPRLVTQAAWQGFPPRTMDWSPQPTTSTLSEPTEQNNVGKTLMHTSSQPVHPQPCATKKLLKPERHKPTRTQTRVTGNRPWCAHTKKSSSRQWTLKSKN